MYLLGLWLVFVIFPDQTSRTCSRRVDDNVFTCVIRSLERFPLNFCLACAVMRWMRSVVDDVQLWTCHWKDSARLSFLINFDFFYYHCFKYSYAMNIIKKHHTKTLPTLFGIKSNNVNVGGREKLCEKSQ